MSDQIDPVQPLLPERRWRFRRREDVRAAERLVQRAPFGEVMIMAERRKGSDEAVEFIALRREDGQVAAIPLRLKREHEGWRVIVPPAAQPPDPWQDAPTLPEP